ncbi:hypothetical protein [Coraliomargarita akajimensis]|nr:hypothetical protein [Coraliomargarita akajimensis]
MSFRSFFGAALLCGVTVLGSAQSSFMTYMGEDAEVVVHLRGLEDLRERWSDNPLAASFGGEAWSKFFESSLSRLLEDAEGEGPGFVEVLEDEFGLTPEELTKLFPGQFALVFYDLSGAVRREAQGGEDFEAEFALMAEFSGSEERLNELMQVQFERNAELQQSINPAIEHEWVIEEFMGLKLHLDERFDGERTVVEDGYAFVDGVVVLARPAERLRSVVEAIKEGPDLPLIETDAYLRSREEGSRGDFGFYVNLQRLLPPYLELFYEGMVEGGLSMGGVTQQTLSDAFALEELESAYVDLDLSESGVLMNSGLIYREKKGLLNLIAYSDGDLPEPNYVPESLLSSTVSLFDFGAMLTALEATFRVASPSMMPLFDLQLMQIRQASGVDLRVALLENFGGELVSLTQLPDLDINSAEALLEAEQVFAVQIHDSQALSDALSALMDMAPMVKPMFSTQEFEGYTIHSMSDASGVDPAEQVSYVITRDQLIFCIGRIGLLQTVLSNMGSRQTGFWGLESTELLFESIERPNVVARSYLDVSQQFQVILDVVNAIGIWDEDLEFIDVDALPDDMPPGLKIVSEINESPDGLFSRALLLQEAE